MVITSGSVTCLNLIARPFAPFSQEFNRIQKLLEGGATPEGRRESRDDDDEMCLVDDIHLYPSADINIADIHRWLATDRFDSVLYLAAVLHLRLAGAAIPLSPQ